MVDRIRLVALSSETVMMALHDIAYDFRDEQKFRQAAAEAEKALQEFWSLAAERDTLRRGE